MVAFKLSAFSGERPLIIPRLLADTGATTAENVRLNDGGLTPIRKSAQSGTIADATHKTIYRHEGDWLSWSGLVHAAPGPVAQDRLYFTGDGVPKVLIAGTTYPLAVPRPSGALTAVSSGGGSGDTQSRTYAYTFVTSFGEESAPSPASSIIDWKPGETVTLSGFAAAPAGRSVTLQRIYRSQTGDAGTYLYLIAERAASAGDFVDTVAVDAFEEVLPSASWTEPPDDLVGLVSMPNGMMAAFSGRDVYFCEPWRPHAWPEKYAQQVDAEIVGLAALGSILVVMTEGYPYLMTGSHPDSMQSQKLERNYPCINARSIVDLGYAACYATHEGLVAVGVDGSVRLVTEELFSREDWLTMSPITILGGQLDGIYVLFYDNVLDDGTRFAGSLFLHVEGQPFLVRASAIAAACFYDVGDAALFYTETGAATVYRFDAPYSAPERLYWRSKEFWLTAPFSLGAILIDTGNDLPRRHEVAQDEIDSIVAANAAIYAAGDLLGEINAAPLNVVRAAGDLLQPVPSLSDYYQMTVGIYADGKLLQTVSSADRIVRIKAGLKARRWEVDVSTNQQVAQIVMASSVEELRSIA